MNEREQIAVSIWMNKLPLVKWDRTLRIDEVLYVYGWIDRPDGRSDFVSLRFANLNYDLPPELVTSAAKYSLKLHQLLEYTPIDCKRVSDMFGDKVDFQVPPGYGIPPSYPNPEA